MEDKNSEASELTSDLTSQNENKVVVLPPKNSKRKFVVIGATIALVLFIVGGSSVLGVKYQNKSKVTVDTVVEITPTPITFPTPPSTVAVVVDVNNFNLQDFLSENCKKVGTSDAYFYGFKSDSLPFTYDESHIKPDLRNGSYFTCGDYEPKRRNGYIPLGEDVKIYDNDSEELGHGGPNFLGEYGKEIENKNNIKLLVSFGGLPHEEGTLLEDITVNARGIKTIKNQNGEFYIITNSEVIPANDPRLLILLNKYSSDSKYDPSKKVLKMSETVENDIINQFFSNPSNLSNPEKEKVDKIRNTLDSIKLKGE